MDCNPADSSIHEISQARILECVALQAVPCIAGRFFTNGATFLVFLFTGNHLEILRHCHIHLTHCLIFPPCAKIQLLLPSPQKKCCLNSIVPTVIIIPNLLATFDTVPISLSWNAVFPWLQWCPLSWFLPTFRFYSYLCEPPPSLFPPHKCQYSQVFCLRCSTFLYTFFLSYYIYYITWFQLSSIMLNLHLNLHWRWIRTN